jgi:hypothetical protein
MDFVAISSAAEFNPAQLLAKAGAKAIKRATDRANSRDETPAEQTERLGVATSMIPLARQMAARHNLEYINQEETSRAVYMRAEQQLKVTGQLK